LLESIRQLEANGASAPNFVRIVKESSNDVRDALMFLELSSQRVEFEDPLQVDRDRRFLLSQRVEGSCDRVKRESFSRF
jgi:hypothetical protein